MKNIQVLVGCDPEVFVKKDGVFVSAYGLIKGDKKNPQKVNRGAVQVDGMALEFNTDPAETEDEFLLNVSDVFNTLKLMCPNHEIATVPVADFSLDYIKAQPQEAKELGCDPDFNAWLSSVNEKPNGEVPMRTASGHVHIGWGKDFDTNSYDHQLTCEAVVKQMDFYLGLPSLRYDNDLRRRSLYGKAGCYRPKVYGTEYRTLSNAWLKSPELIKWVFRQVQKGMSELMNGNILADKYGDIQEIINTSQLKEANAIIKHEGIEVCLG